MSKKNITLGHSPDADDAFMFYAVSKGIVKSKKIEITHIIKDIQTLNSMAINQELDTTAVSAHAYVQLYDTYRVMDCGASMGDRYGPIVVSKPEITTTQGIKIAIPGELTSAFLLLKLYCNDAEFIQYDFDQIIPAVLNSEVDAGLVIHEGQLTFEDFGLKLLLDLPKLWYEECEHPIPLGLNVISRSLDLEIQIEVSQLVKRSIAYALSNIDEALDYAMEFGRGVSRSVAREFVLMYVNKDTLDLNYRGIKGLKFMYDSAFTKGLIKKNIKLDIIVT
ncbi:MAG: ABC transporter substrate-binding protein [Spirochaetales bacterium]|nr:ABC transporter substrate-binding protein [Spirochaetales bacterium]